MGESSYALLLVSNGLWRGWREWRGLLADSQFTFSYVHLRCNSGSHFASRESARSRGLPAFNVSSSAMLLEAGAAGSPHTSFTAVSSSILRCKSSKMPCPKSASAADMVYDLCCGYSTCLELVRLMAEVVGCRKFDGCQNLAVSNVSVVGQSGIVATSHLDTSQYICFVCASQVK